MRLTLIALLILMLLRPQTVMTAAGDACRVEHYISDETFQALKRHLAQHAEPGDAR